MTSAAAGSLLSVVPVWGITKRDSGAEITLHGFSGLSRVSDLSGRMGWDLSPSDPLTQPLGLIHTAASDKIRPAIFPMRPRTRKQHNCFPLNLSDHNPSAYTDETSDASTWTTRNNAFHAPFRSASKSDAIPRKYLPDFRCAMGTGRLQDRPSAPSRQPALAASLCSDSITAFGKQREKGSAFCSCFCLLLLHPYVF